MSAWVKSHQSIWSHAKTRKAARALGIPDVHLVGHLHALWHWALDHAEDGNLSRYDHDDIAIAARWEGDAAPFVQALIGCGPGGAAGFLEHDGPYGDPADGKTGNLVLHDWWDYAGKLVSDRRKAREAGAHGNHVKYGVTDPNCTRCVVFSSGGDSGGDRGATGSAIAEEEEEEEREKTQGQERHDPPGRDPTPEPDVDEQARTLTRRFALAARNNGHKIPAAGTPAHRAWLVEMDRLLRLGAPGGTNQPTDPDEIAAVIDWATTDEFERAVVLSVPKLRKRYTTLRLRALNRRTNGQPKGPPRPPAEGDVDYRAGWSGREATP